MNATTKRVILLSSCSLVIGLVFGALLFARTKTIKETIPVITTLHDTITTVPAWLEDSIKVWKKKVYVTDTIPIYKHSTVIDTNWVFVDSQRVVVVHDTVPRAWPILEYHTHGDFGDNGTVITFNVRDGRGATNNFYTAGILTDLEWDTLPTPRMNFRPFPPAEKHNWLYAPKLIGAGSILGLATCGLISAIKSH